MFLVISAFFLLLASSYQSGSAFFLSPKSPSEGRRQVPFERSFAPASWLFAEEGGAEAAGSTAVAEPSTDSSDAAAEAGEAAESKGKRGGAIRRRTSSRRWKAQKGARYPRDGGTGRPGWATMYNAKYKSRPLIPVDGRLDLMDGSIAKQMYFVDKPKNRTMIYPFEDIVREARGKYADDAEKLEIINKNAEDFNKTLTHRKKRMELLSHAMKRHGLSLRADSYDNRAFIFYNARTVKSTVYKAYVNDLVTRRCGIRPRWQEYCREKLNITDFDSLPLKRKLELNPRKDRFYHEAYLTHTRAHPEDVFRWLSYEAWKNGTTTRIGGGKGKDKRVKTGDDLDLSDLPVEMMDNAFKRAEFGD